MILDDVLTSIPSSTKSYAPNDLSLLSHLYRKIVIHFFLQLSLPPSLENRWEVQTVNLIKTKFVLNIFNRYGKLPLQYIMARSILSCSVNIAFKIFLQWFSIPSCKNPQNSRKRRLLERREHIKSTVSAFLGGSNSILYQRVLAESTQRNKKFLYTRNF